MKNFIYKLFKLDQAGSTIGTEIVAGLTTFAAMSYIIALNPLILSGLDGMSGAVFMATILASAIGTALMGIIAGVPYATAPGLGLNSLAAGLVGGTLGFTPAQVLSIVFISGIINVLITVTNARKEIIKAMPASLQSAIGGGIGIFVAFIGLVNVGLISFGTGYPAINEAISWQALTVFLFGLVLTIILLLKNVKGAILIGVIASALLGVPLGVTGMEAAYTFSDAVKAFPQVFGIIFTKEGIPSLFTSVEKILTVAITIISFSISDTFDTLGTFIGTGRVSGIFTDEDLKDMNTGSGFDSKMDKALLADAIATPIGAILGTSSTTTYVESAAGIGAGGRTGLTSIITSICFLLSAFAAPLISRIPYAATAPALVIVGVMMLASFKEINWTDLEEAIPGFGAGCFMALTYGITNGVMAGFLLYTLTELALGKYKKIHPVIWLCDMLFIISFII